MRILVTSGPTREYIDDVRFITNDSSGKMGFAVACEARDRGLDVCVVAGPTLIKPPTGVELISVKTSDEMIDETLRELSSGYDAFVCAAAISDFRVVGKSSGKIKSAGELTLRLAPNRKLTSLSRERFPDLFIVGFKAEYCVSQEELVASAQAKLEKDRLDVIVANDIGVHEFGVDETEVKLIGKGGVVEPVKGSKLDVACRLIDLIEELC
ncbi:MAG: phosphopantothenoylcysteine decarboxylase [Methanobacteriota archaeon]